MDGNRIRPKFAWDMNLWPSAFIRSVPETHQDHYSIHGKANSRCCEQLGVANVHRKTRVNDYRQRSIEKNRKTMEKALVTASVITDQRQKIKQYKHILSSVISANDIVQAKKFIDHSNS